jgi:hypothetical protein
MALLPQPTEVGQKEKRPKQHQPIHMRVPVGKNGERDDYTSICGESMILLHAPLLLIVSRFAAFAVTSMVPVCRAQRESSLK